MAITHYLSAKAIDPPISRSAGKSIPSVNYFGSVRTHPYDNRKIVIVPYPYKGSQGIYEFNKEDVLYAENTSEVVNEDGDILTVMRVFIRKGAHAVNLRPFTVSH